MSGELFILVLKIKYLCAKFKNLFIRIGIIGWKWKTYATFVL